jgi:alpha-amylase
MPMRRKTAEPFKWNGMVDRIKTCLTIDRTKNVGDVVEISAWLGFTFPGRKEKYSDMTWHWDHFTGTDWVAHLVLGALTLQDEKTKKKAIFRILGDGKYWASSVDKEKGNYDYLMFADIDHAHPEVLFSCNWSYI